MAAVGKRVRVGAATPKRRLRTAWRNLSSIERWLLAVGWSLGAVLFTVSTFVVGADSWNHHPFLLDMTSAFTSGLFGVPVAIVVIGRVSAQAADRASALAAARAARQSGVTLWNRLVELYGDPADVDGRSPFGYLASIRDRVGEILPLLRDLGVSPPPGEAPRDRVERVERAESVAALCRPEIKRITAPIAKQPLTAADDTRAYAFEHDLKALQTYDPQRRCNRLAQVLSERWQRITGRERRDWNPAGRRYFAEHIDNLRDADQWSNLGTFVYTLHEHFKHLAAIERSCTYVDELVRERWPSVMPDQHDASSS